MPRGHWTLEWCWCLPGGTVRELIAVLEGREKRELNQGREAAMDEVAVPGG